MSKMDGSPVHGSGAHRIHIIINDPTSVVLNRTDC